MISGGYILMMPLNNYCWAKIDHIKGTRNSDSSKRTNTQNNTMTSQMTKITAMALLLNWASAAIAENGIWTNNDWYNNALNIGVRNGEPYSNDDTVRRRITSPISVDGDINNMDYNNFANVQRIKRLFPESDWARGFPVANAVYTYDNFLKAAAKFPKFCNESNMPNYDDD